MTKKQNVKPSNAQERRRGRDAANAKPHSLSRPIIIWAILGVGVIAVCVFAAWRINAGRRTPAAPSENAPAQTTPVPPSASRSADFKTLVGRWVRTDSPYVIEIRDVGNDGQLEAAYFNPRPINVSRAEARQKDGALGIFVELRDVNYPGSSYALVYDSKTDMLQGVYFQAVQKRRYDVTFARLQTR